MSKLSLPRVQHVSIPYAPGQAGEARVFYGDLLGLVEMTVPESLDGRDLIWYRLGDTELHLFIEEEPEAETYGRHLCIQVTDLEAVETNLTTAGHTVRQPTAIPNRPRFMCRDPFGNLIEFTQIEGEVRY